MRSRGLGLAKKLIFKLVVTAWSPISPSAAMMATYTAKSASMNIARARDGAARPCMALMMNERRARPVGRRLHDEQTAARMDLLKALFDRGLDTLNIEAIRHGSFG